MTRKLQWLYLLLALIAFVGVYFYITSAVDAQNNKVRKPRPEAPEQALALSVINAEMGSYAAKITASGLAKPRYALTLTNQVSGRVLSISDKFEPGQLIPKGHVLSTLENADLIRAVASAKNTVANAELALKEEIRQGEQAQAEWQASGFTEAPDSDLVLRAPQLAAAKTELASAKAELANALYDLNNTRLIAPFDALVVNRTLSPGAYLSMASEVGTLYSTDRVEIVIDLANSDWLKLPDTQTLLKTNWPVTIQSVDSPAQWQGRILHVGLHIDEETRMRSLTVALNNPLSQASPLIPGSFVEISLQGKSLDKLWRLPNTALSKKSEIWYLDDDSRLATFETTPRFVDEKYVYIDVPENMQDKTYQVLIQPYNSYIKGTLVKPLSTSSATGQKKGSKVAKNTPKDNAL
ncbi:efflux RND transporter periplasmic adaptor subunit [Marinomonas algarum]|uniref:Efflux RND transporter periplasmic adaptor subunit n=1 Tax=Marinomonas algarum TaxID=2883105 RepID=A0A9X1LDE6_9GAMM|nr:efflux RND transporter periplasmic adaptor subunit [Marinomonas algarum]MCB5162447.1 efflux RND transporter periplasmic adaptor subunit [Marinomonas algarum]